MKMTFVFIFECNVGLAICEVIKQPPDPSHLSNKTFLSINHIIRLFLFMCNFSTYVFTRNYNMR